MLGLFKSDTKEKAIQSDHKKEIEQIDREFDLQSLADSLTDKESDNLARILSGVMQMNGVRSLNFSTFDLVIENGMIYAITSDNEELNFTIGD